jgi:hypothetical protein
MGSPNEGRLWAWSTILFHFNVPQESAGVAEAQAQFPIPKRKSETLAGRRARAKLKAKGVVPSHPLLFSPRPDVVMDQFLLDLLLKFGFSIGNVRTEWRESKDFPGQFYRMIEVTMRVSETTDIPQEDVWRMIGGIVEGQQWRVRVFDGAEFISINCEYPKSLDNPRHHLRIRDARIVLD